MRKLLLAILIALPGFAFAQTPQHLKASEAFVEVSGLKTSFDGVVDAMLKTQLGAVPEQYREKFTAVMKEFMGKHFNYQTLKPRLAKIYADEFTEKELNELVAFYSSPTGKKFADKASYLMQKGMEMGKTVVEENKPELEKMIKEAFAQ